MLMNQHIKKKVLTSVLCYRMDAIHLLIYATKEFILCYVNDGGCGERIPNVLLNTCDIAIQ